jgi:hypothetical protein
LDLNFMRVQDQFHAAQLALGQQHIQNRSRRSVAEQLPERLLVPGNPVPLNQFDKVSRSIERQRRLGKMRIFRQEISRPAVQIRKIAPPAAGDEDFPARLPIVLQQRHAPPALPGHRRAHQSGRART